MKISFDQLSRLVTPPKVIIHSLDLALYQVTVDLPGGGSALLVSDNGKPYRERNLNAVRDALQGIAMASLWLRQQSAYDEMVGQPPPALGTNALELRLDQGGNADQQDSLPCRGCLPDCPNRPYCQGKPWRRSGLH